MPKYKRLMHKNEITKVKHLLEKEESFWIENLKFPKELILKIKDAKIIDVQRIKEIDLSQNLKKADYEIVRNSQNMMKFHYGECPLRPYISSKGTLIWLSTDFIEPFHIKWAIDIQNQLRRSVRAWSDDIGHEDLMELVSKGFWIDV